MLAACLCLPFFPQDALSNDGRHGLKKALLEDWAAKSTMVCQDQLPTLPEQRDPTKDCQRLGFCVCQGVGAAAQLYVRSLVMCLKPMFTPPKKKKKKKEETAVNPPQQMPDSPDEVDPPHVKILKANQKLFVQGMIVLKVSKHVSEDTLTSDFDILGAGWATLALESLLGEPVQGPKDGSSFPDELWFHVGHVNLNNWSMTLLKLNPVGLPTCDGLQRLEVQELFVKHSVIFFAKLLSEPAFEISWDVEFYIIETNADRVLEGEEVKPNWLLVKRFQPDSTLQSRICFWRGLQTEHKNLKSKKKKSQQRKPKSKKHKEKSASKFGHKLNIKRVSKRLKKRLGLRSSIVDQSVPAEGLMDDEQGSENDFDLEPQDHLSGQQQEQELLEDILAERSEHPIQEENEQVHEAFVGNNFDDDSEASDLDLSDIEAAVTDALVDAPADSLEPPQPASASSGSRDPPVEKPLHASVPSQPEAVSHVPKSVSARFVTERRPRVGPDLAVEVTSTSEMRYNELSGRITAVCKMPGHGDCRRSRTTSEGAQRYPGQGRPLGLLTHFLLTASQYPDGPSHRKALDSQVEFASRKTARDHFKSLPGSESITREERKIREGEQEEPETIR